MKSFGITSLYLILALFQVASVNAMRPHSFLIPNTEVMTAAESENAEVTFSRRRGSNANSNSNNKEVDTVVRILRGNNWGMTSSSSSSSSSTTTFVSGAGEESSSRSN